MMRRRRGVIAARSRRLAGLSGVVQAVLGSQAVAAAVTPRADRIIDLLGLGPDARYLDIGCGTARYAHLLAQRAGLGVPPLSLDLAAARGPVDVIGWPERLPFRDGSFDVVTSLYYIRRLDDDTVHGFAEELARVLAPGGVALLLEVAPVRASWLDRCHRWAAGWGGEGADLRGWGRLAALLTECGFDEITLVNLGPFLLPPIPRVGVLLQRWSEAGGGT